MARGKPHNPEVKAAAMAALLAGQSVDRVAEELSLPRETVKNWRRKIRNGEPLDPKKVQTDELGELILGYLRESLTTLQAQARFYRDETWLREQDASEVAVLHGVLTDKAIRILSAIESVSDTD